MTVLVENFLFFLLVVQPKKAKNHLTFEATLGSHSWLVPSLLPHRPAKPGWGRMGGTDGACGRQCEKGAVKPTQGFVVSAFTARILVFEPFPRSAISGRRDLWILRLLG